MKGKSMNEAQKLKVTQLVGDGIWALCQSKVFKGTPRERKQAAPDFRKR